jgi:hypothetical protein
VGFQQRSLFAIPYRDLEAIVSELDDGMLQATGEHVLRHEAVVEAVRQMGPALPVRFGALMRDRAAVADALATRYATLVEDLERLGDKIEMGLAVLWREPEVASTAGQDDTMHLESRGARYLRAKFSQYRHDALLRDRAERLSRELDRELAPLVLDRRYGVLPTRRLVMRAAYLLHSPAVKTFQGAFSEVRRKYPDLRFLLTGPWPPYSFVTTTDTEKGPGLDTREDRRSVDLGSATPA